MKTPRIFVRALVAAGLVAAALAVPTAPAYAFSGDPGTDDIGTMIVGGSPATENYSWLVYTSGCTGTLIKSNWVVTARHCSTPSSVRVGSINRTSGGTVVSVIGSVSHSSADVKLLRLASSVSHAPAPIPTIGHPVGTATRIIGWGLACPTRGCGSAPTVARELDTSVVADSRCLGINGPLEICTNNTGGNQGACYGDSGGPQVRRISGDSRWFVIGATSRSGNGSSVCATGPSIYGDLVAIRSWINTQVGGLPA
ncbi:S1 family peptidase [Allorhizocola rhizosphaerae]|uniref:S1 family peptidase n=1 Tax=Allorhizocola rhizosphaerae TaxID=1872709 RepID=UPI0014796DC6|nr:trypsin-like serine protease [Allorhizocola rhizosphaerae]